MNNVSPLGDDVEQHRALLLIHGRGFQALGLDGDAILSGTEYEIGQPVAQNRLLPLVIIEGIE